MKKVEATLSKPKQKTSPSNIQFQSEILYREQRTVRNSTRNNRYTGIWFAKIGTSSSFKYRNSIDKTEIIIVPSYYIRFVLVLLIC